MKENDVTSIDLASYSTDERAFVGHVTVRNESIDRFEKFIRELNNKISESILSYGQQEEGSE